MKLKSLLTILTFFITLKTWANFDNYQVNVMTGMANVSYTETASALEGDTSTNSPSSGSTSVLPLNFELEKFTDSTWSWVFTGTAPLISSPAGNYIFGGAGRNWYFKSLSTIGEFEDAGNKMKIVPKWRFHIGGGLGAAYLVYTTETAKKTDLLAEIYFNGGVTHNFSEKWAIRGQATLARGAGVNTSTIAMKVFVGTSFSLDF